MFVKANKKKRTLANIKLLHILYRHSNVFKLYYEYALLKKMRSINLGIAISKIIIVEVFHPLKT